MNAHAHRMIEAARQQAPQPLGRIPIPGTGPRSNEALRGLRGQAGSMLLEAFIAILIFSMGILAIVGMQASAIKNSADAKYRSEASLLASELLGKMWVSDRTPATLQANFQGGGGVDGSGYTPWYSSVQAILPQSSTYTPTVSVDPTTGLVTITLRWKAPSEPAADPAHSYNVVAQIR